MKHLIRHSRLTIWQLFYFSISTLVFQLQTVTPQQNATNTSSSLPQCPGKVHGKKIICYMTNWAHFRDDKIQFSPEIIDPSLCTHIVYAYAHLNETTYLIQLSNVYADIEQNTLLRVINIKKLNPNVKIMIALGGWGDSGFSKYSELIADPIKRSAFNDHVNTFLTLYKFDGLNLHWEYPTYPQLESGNLADRTNFAIWVAELKNALGCKLLSSIVSSQLYVAETAYDPSIYKHLDWIEVMTFNYHGFWGKYTGYVAPLYSDANVQNSVDVSIQYYIRQGCPPEKLILGISAYGRTFTLNDTQKHGIGDPVNGAGLPGLYTKEAGLLAYYEFLEQKWTQVSNERFGTYAYRGNQWISIDNPEMVKLKTEYVNQNNLGGILFYTIDMDTFQPKNGSKFGSFDLVKAAKEHLVQPANNATGNDETSRNQLSLILVTSLPFAIIAILACIGIAVGLSVYKRDIGSLKEQLRQLTKTEIEDFLYGNQNIDPNDLNASIHSAPFDRKYELSEKQLVIAHDKIIGSGQYGLVLMGIVESENNGVQYANEMMEVAVKTVKPDVDVMYFKALLSEVKIMAFLGPHDNVVSLIGARTDKIDCREIYIAIEYCANGDLLGVLKQSGNNFRNLLTSENSKPVDIEKSEDLGETNSIPLSTFNDGKELLVEMQLVDENEEGISSINLIEWSRQISNGLAYLCKKKVIHGDLAARNILLTSNNVAKISDFGLSRQLLNYNNYTKTTVTPLPWRWMAIESLKEMKFSLQSDIWSFGVVLWEIFTLGELPYPGWNWNSEFCNMLSRGELWLDAPQYSDKQIYDLMLECWTIEPSERITMERMSNELHQIILRITSVPNSNGAYVICN